MESCPVDIEEIRAVRSMMIFDKYLHIVNKNWFGMISCFLNCVVNEMCFSIVYTLKDVVCFDFPLLINISVFIALTFKLIVCKINSSD